MAEIKIKAVTRVGFGKGPARRIRRENMVPAVLYGHGSDPLHVSLPGHELMLALKHPNALLSVELDGDNQLALPKDVQRDPIRGSIEHADLLLVRRGERVTVNVPVVLVGDADPTALVVTETTEVPIEAEATHLPEAIEVSIEGLGVGTQITAADLSLPAGVALAIDAEHLIVNLTAAPTAEQLDAELAEAEADAGIERDESVTDEPVDSASEAAPETGDEGSAAASDEE